MIISFDPKFILFSVNKTGTSSMDRALRRYFDEGKARENLARSWRTRVPLTRDDRVVGKRIRAEKWNDIPRLKHATPKWLRGRLPAVAPGHDWDDFFRFCFVRNPFDRLLSIYSFHTQQLAHRYPKAVEAGSFRRWLELGGTGSATRPMRRFVVADDGRPLVDFVGRYEQLEADWRAVTARLGLPAIELGREPRTETAHAPWQEVYTPELVEIVMRNPVWAADVEHFDYSPATA